MATVPRLDFPIRLAPDGKRLATVEQDTVGDYAACVQMAFLTQLGEFTALPDYGIEDYTFDQQPIGEDRVRAAVLAAEPRAEILVAEAPDVMDALVDRLTVVVSGGQGG